MCFGVARARFQTAEVLRAGVERREVGGVARRERREIIDRDVVFASGGSQREQALLDAFQFARVVIGGAQRRFEMGARVLERVERRVERFDGGLDQRGRLGGAALQAAYGRRQHRNGGATTGDGLVRV